MAAGPRTRNTLQTLAAFRHELRMFLQFSEQAAARSGLQPQQHQLLLQIAGAPEGSLVTIAYVAERLGLRHNSAVELINRSAEAGLVVRVADPEDHRRIRLVLTPSGTKTLHALSEEHAAELNDRAPRLIDALRRIQKQKTRTVRLERPKQQDRT